MAVLCHQVTYRKGRGEGEGELPWFGWFGTLEKCDIAVVFKIMKECGGKKEEVNNWSPQPVGIIVYIYIDRKNYTQPVGYTVAP